MSEKGYKKGGFKGGLEGILGGVTDLLEKLGELAEKGESLSRTGEIHGKDMIMNWAYLIPHSFCPSLEMA
jgi:hypothetical protein